MMAQQSQSFALPALGQADDRGCAGEGGKQAAARRFDENGFDGHTDGPLNGEAYAHDYAGGVVVPGDRPDDPQWGLGCSAQEGGQFSRRPVVFAATEQDGIRSAHYGWVAGEKGSVGGDPGQGFEQPIGQPSPWADVSGGVEDDKVGVVLGGQSGDV